MKPGELYLHSAENARVSIAFSETLRYMNCKIQNPAPEVCSLAERAIRDAERIISPRGVFGIYDLKAEKGLVEFASLEIKSEKLFKNLQSCNRVIALAVTIGFEADRMISKHLVSEPSYALALNSACTAAIEAYADLLVSELLEKLKPEGFSLRPRFSPGYGDFSLDFQKDIINLLDAKRKAAISLTNDLMMVPSKSVTALIGICSGEEECPVSGCESCSKKNCKFRRNI